MKRSALFVVSCCMFLAACGEPADTGDEAVITTGVDSEKTLSREIAFRLTTEAERLEERIAAIEEEVAELDYASYVADARRQVDLLSDLTRMGHGLYALEIYLDASAKVSGVEGLYSASDTFDESAFNERFEPAAAEAENRYNAALEQLQDDSAALRAMAQTAAFKGWTNIRTSPQWIQAENIAGSFYYLAKGLGYLDAAEVLASLTTDYPDNVWPWTPEDVATMIESIDDRLISFSREVGYKADFHDNIVAMNTEIELAKQLLEKGLIEGACYAALEAARILDALRARYEGNIPELADLPGLETALYGKPVDSSLQLMMIEKARMRSYSDENSQRISSAAVENTIKTYIEEPEGD